MVTRRCGLWNVTTQGLGHGAHRAQAATLVITAPHYLAGSDDYGALETTVIVTAPQVL